MGMGYLTYPAATQIHISVRGKNLLINNKLKKKKKTGKHPCVYIFWTSDFLATVTCDFGKQVILKRAGYL